jgi:hypothetical protein
MHAFHDYIAKQLSERLKQKRVVVWYDSRSEFRSFINELLSAADSSSKVPNVMVADLPTRLAVCGGSLFELRAMVEPYVAADEPDSVLLYLAGFEHDRKASVLMELEKGGECYEPQLKRLARNVLRRRYIDGQIDEILARERVTYEELSMAASDSSSAGPPSSLKSIFREAPASGGIIANWLASASRDGEIVEKEAIGELIRLLKSKIGLELSQEASLKTLRSITLRYVLANEFRAEMSGTMPPCLESVSTPRTKDEGAAIRELAQALRATFGEAYPQLADTVEAELGIAQAKILPDALDSIDTFRFEERLALSHCENLIARSRFEEARQWILRRENGFWINVDMGRKAQWEACRLMAELGVQAALTSLELDNVSDNPNAWVKAYSAQDGWHRLDRAQRRLETWLAKLDDEPNERALGIVRRAYEDVCNAMAERFTETLARAKWNITDALHQTQIYGELVNESPKPVAYFLVDAMRFEMGVELAERLPKSAETLLRAAVGSLPSITPIGMAALQIGASNDFSVAEQNGKLGACIDSAFLPDLASRKKFLAARVPKLLDMTLDELLTVSRLKLAKKVADVPLIVVRSQEIDQAGEGGFMYARQVMDSIIDNVARGIRKLAALGVEHSIITADHGHLFSSWDREEAMRIDSPGGDVVDLHRRCWIGRGGSTPPACIRVAASALGYASDLDLVFPKGAGVFKAGGDLAFHHGGPSLQEIVIPALKVRMTRADAPAAVGQLLATGLPDVVTNRVFSVTLQLGGANVPLFTSTINVRPLLMSAGRQVGYVGMAIGAQPNEAGCLELQPGKPVTVAFVLSDESAPSLRLVVQDPATDADLYRSTADIPVRLGV